MVKKTEEIQTVTPPLGAIGYTNTAVLAARTNVAKTGQDTEVGPVKKTTAEQSETKKPANEGFSMLAYMAFLAEANQNLRNADEPFDLLTYEELLEKGELDQSDLYNADVSDERVRNLEVAEYVDKDGDHHYYTGRDLENFRSSRGRGAAFKGIDEKDLGPDNFRMRTVGEVQRELVSAIQTASAATGVPTGLLGAMAGKESTFKGGQVSVSGAIGFFQQTGGYRDAFWNNKANASRVAAIVPEAAQYLNNDGKIDRAEARRLAWNPTASAMMTAIRAKELARDKGLDLNNKDTWGLVYTEHNAGRGSLNKLLNGGMTDGWIQRLNPSMYNGASSASDVLAIADRDMKRWGNRFENMATQLGMSSGPTRVAANEGSSPRPAARPHHDNDDDRVRNRPTRTFNAKADNDDGVVAQVTKLASNASSWAQRKFSEYVPNFWS